MAKQSAFESLQSIGLEIISNDSVRNDITTAYLYIKRETSKPNLVTETINELETLLKPHILVDRERLILDKKASWVSNREIPFKFNNYQDFLNDDMFLYAIMNSIKMRHGLNYVYNRYITGLEYYIYIIEKEIESLELQ